MHNIIGGSVQWRKIRCANQFRFFDVRKLKDTEKKLFQALVDELHAQFVADAASGRNMSEKIMAKLADGRVYTGQRALKLKLIDRLGNLFCLAAVAAGVEDKLQRTRDAARRVALDGCEDHCAAKTLRQAGLPVDEHVVLTDIGIDKNPSRPSVVLDTARTVEHVHKLLA